jgi:phosphatidylglycerophosphate synthase
MRKNMVIRLNISPWALILKHMVNEINLKEIYPEWKEKANKVTVWEYYFARKIAFLILPFFLRSGISANQISFVSIFLGIISAILISTGGFWCIIFGGILMQIWLILDKTDGLIARYKKTTSKMGEFLEEFNGSLIAVLFFLSIGFAASKIPGFLPFYIPPKIFIVLGLATSLFVSFRHLVSSHFAAIFPASKETKGISAGGGKLSVLYDFSVKFTGVYSLAQPIFLMAAIFNFLGLYVLIYFFIQGLLMLVNSAYLLIKANKN